MGPNFNLSAKKKGLKLKPGVKKNVNLKLDKNLKSIENRILQKMKNKQMKVEHIKMPSLDRNSSPHFNYGSPVKVNLHKVHSYEPSDAKNYRYPDGIGKDTLGVSMNKRHPGKLDKANRSQSIRQTVVGSFRPNDPDSIIRSIQVPRPVHENHSEYDLYNSYGSSNGFTDEKRLSDRMRNRIKATFKLRDEVETADSDSFFSSKFSKFSVPRVEHDAQMIIKPNKNKISELMMKQQSGTGESSNFPNIKKHVPSGDVGFALPKLK
jgi:hypothetical protein